MGELAESVSRISPHIPNRQPLGSPKSSINSVFSYPRNCFAASSPRWFLRQKTICSLDGFFAGIAAGPDGQAPCCNKKNWNKELDLLFHIPYPLFRLICSKKNISQKKRKRFVTQEKLETLYPAKRRIMQRNAGLERFVLTERACPCRLFLVRKRRSVYRHGGGNGKCGQEAL